MSTRSSIGIKRKDGTIECIYCHSDGYLEYNGKLILIDTFTIVFGTQLTVPSSELQP